jgi:cell division protein FtsB
MNRENTTGLNAGLVVRKEMARQHWTKARLGRKTGRGPRSITRTIAGTTIQARVLWEFSLALGRNFFTDLAQQLDAVAPTLAKAEGAEDELQQLRKENERLRTELEYLRAAIDIIKRG